eukprot:3964989-Alexandrium_andersonii.AAC.1
MYDSNLSAWVPRGGANFFSPRAGSATAISRQDSHINNICMCFVAHDTIQSCIGAGPKGPNPVSYTHLRAHETSAHL